MMFSDTQKLQSQQQQISVSTNVKSYLGRRNMILQQDMNLYKLMKSTRNNNYMEKYKIFFLFYLNKSVDFTIKSYTQKEDNGLKNNAVRGCMQKQNIQ